MYLNMVVPPEVAQRMARHLEQLDLNYTKSLICHEREGSHFGKTRFTGGPRPGKEAPDAKPLLYDSRSTTLFELLRGPKHTLLCSEAAPTRLSHGTGWPNWLSESRAVWKT